MELSLLTQRRNSGPYGMEGGQVGSPGKQTLMRSNQEVRKLNSICSVKVKINDRLIIETPGGGGFGKG